MLRPGDRIVVAGIAALGACTWAGPLTVDRGDCAPLPGSRLLELDAFSLDYYHEDAPPLLTVVTSRAAWDAAFVEPVEPPAGVDFARRRYAIVRTRCNRLRPRFVAEAPSQVVVGVYEPFDDLCAIWPLVFALPPAATPVRVARCTEVCIADDCGI